jgi:crotonobetainyl-CoA:carnitine CoA-transferase CaiB-like acyl-CoA transferase
VRVLDLTRFIAGPYCTMLLADQGAEVVKVEPPGGEETRALEPMLGEETRVSAYFLRYNRSKKSICLDLKSDPGRGVLELLVRSADVLVENFRPGVLERLGFGWPRLAALNERLVYCTITGFGHSESPLRDRGAFTPIVEAATASLIHSSSRERPSISGYPVGDIFPASLAAAAIGMALYRRERDGLGARVDMAMYDGMLSMNERAIGMSAMLGRDWLPGVPADMGSAPTGVYQAADGFITLAVVGEPMWQRFCAALGRPDWAADAELASGPGRAERHDVLLLPGIEAWLATKSRAEAVALLTEAGVPAAEAARPLEVVESEQARARGMIIRFPTYGEAVATAAASPIRFGDEPRPDPGAAPAVGEHTVDVLRDWAGLPDGDIDRLLAGGVVVQGRVEQVAGR